MDAFDEKVKTHKRPKTWAELNAQGRFSLPDLLAWFGWHRRTWDRKWKRIFPKNRFLIEGTRLWTREQIDVFEAAYEVNPGIKSGTN